jgi:cytoskeleton protein RodZ
VSIGNPPDGSSPEEGRDSPGSSQEDRISIGRALQQARVEAGRTVDDVSAATRVRVPIVRAIEADDFSRSGGDVYARGHIRMLAHEAGIDPAPLIAQFDAAHGGRPEPTPVPSTPMFEAERIRPERRRPNWTAAMVAAIVVVAGFVGFTVLRGGDDSGGSVKKSTTNQAEGSEPSHPGSPSPSRGGDHKPAPSDSAIAAAPRDKVTVKISAVDDKSWISAKARNGKLLYDGILAKGDSKTFQDDKQVDLILGNAGAIELYVNGKKVDNEFAPGQVERLSYTQGDPGTG